MKIPTSMATSLRNPVHLLALGFGSGLVPWAPGTFGTLAGIPVALALSHFPLTAYLVITVAALLLGIYICGVTARDMGVHDHPSIVWDEITGYMLTMAAAPASWVWWVIGFGYFRLFDIWKPYPIRTLDRRMGGGVGIMLDDVLAGIYAWIALQLTVVVARATGLTSL